MAPRRGSVWGLVLFGLGLLVLLAWVSWLLSLQEQDRRAAFEMCLNMEYPPAMCREVVWGH